ncbi:hypothetical protein N657DRAFT_261360 [Parathielavia appendiculata]|uniref:Uncharacterized protein n=1 Tax=Parathielavia appendiculata TaxID=2587402 RepID=A0AAN6TS86_9PEZI|nr:hypothetical protein N657DRAFT_261360 [Parathielavia appendiculata]
MSAYYDPSQWPPQGQAGWDHQTPPPARSGASSTIPREEPAAFTHQLEEVDRAIDNLVKSGKMFGAAGGRRESLPYPGPARMYPVFGMLDGRPPVGPGSRPHSMAEFGDARGSHPGSNLQNFYASQRHQPSRGSNEAEQMMQAKRRMAAQRERELRNYHQEQQYNRTVLAEMSYGANRPDRTISPGSLSEDDRRKLIAQQRGAMYGDASYADAAGYVDETSAPRAGLPGPPAGPPRLRGGHSPLAYEYGRAPQLHPDAGSQSAAAEAGQGSQPAESDQARANSNSSPQSNPGSKGAYDAAAAQQSTRTSVSSPGGSPPRQGAPGSKPTQGSVAPIGTRPSISGTPTNPALNKRSTTPLASPLGHGYTASGGGETGALSSAPPANPSSAAAEGPNVGLSGWGARPNGWGSKAGLGVQASVWG